MCFITKFAIVTEIGELIVTPKLLVGKTKFTVKNSYQFADLLKKVNIESNEYVVSFDVVSLLTKISINLAKNVACK